MSRLSNFSKENTLWAFLKQILDAGGSCKEMIRKPGKKYQLEESRF